MAKPSTPAEQDPAMLTPMMRQYWNLKAANPDAIMLYRLGDFYEMFFGDAELASRTLNLALTGRDCGLEQRAPMCGIPYNSADGYIARLVAAGHKVAICDQMEDPAQAKGLVRREVVRVITPGTVIEPGMLDESRNNYLCALWWQNDAAGLCFCDISTGLAEVTELAEPDLPQQLVAELAKYLPSEVLLCPGWQSLAKLRDFFKARPQVLQNEPPPEVFAPEGCQQEAARHFGAEALAELEQSPAALRALAAALRYLRHMQKNERCSIRSVECVSRQQFMRLDAASRRNLELCETMRGREKRGSLLWVLDKTKTAMGKRMLRTWVERPLAHLPKISRRLAAVGELLENQDLQEDLTETLQGMQDLERLMSRVVYQSANARELLAVAASLRRLPALRAGLQATKSEALRQLRQSIDPLDDVAERLEATLADEPSASLREGGLIRDGVYPELDDLRSIQHGGKDRLAAVQLQEQEATGIKKLKVGFNRVFGYYIEVTNPYRELVPEHYIRKQTLANCERYITEELKALEAKVLGAAERAVKLEYEIFSQLREELAGHYNRVRQSAVAVATLDVLCSLARVAAQNNYCRPELVPGSQLSIHEGRHPVVEPMLEGSLFVANNTSLNESCRCMVITGPNMAGKSTYMRQVALITLMAQVGSFVPAQSATIGLCDAIFTRVGASDDLASGQSTFMVEMNEVAMILRDATPQSLLVFDEIGRGTSTFDGMSIARAVLEFAADPKKLGARTLFATHYHELAELEKEIEGVQNFAVSVKKRGEDLTFLRRIVRGAADGSYGIEVAKLAGVPESVVRRARAILRGLEPTGATPLRSPPTANPEPDSLQATQQQALVQTLQALDLETLTPLEAMAQLFALVQQAKAL